MVLAPPVRTGKDKLDPRLMSLCMSNDVDPAILDLLGDNGLVTWSFSNTSWRTMQN